MACYESNDLYHGLDLLAGAGESFFLGQVGCSPSQKSSTHPMQSSDHTPIHLPI